MLKRFPMLGEMEEERVASIGGKAAILEAIVQRYPQANVPEFYNSRDQLISAPKEKRVLRASSILDIFGGCGLFDTYQDVDANNFARLSAQILDSKGKFLPGVYATSIGLEYEDPIIISQRQGNPQYWILVLQHSNDPEKYVMAYATCPSVETKFDEVRMNTKHVVDSVKRETETMMVDGAKIIGAPSFNPDLVHKLVETHKELQHANIVSGEYVAILEAGIYEDHIETYQFTPIRTKTREQTPREDSSILVFGESKERRLPIYNIPTYNDVMGLLAGKNALEEYPDFLESVAYSCKRWGELVNAARESSLIWPTIANALAVGFSDYFDNKTPDGYVLRTEMHRSQIFDIPLRKIKGVLIDTAMLDPAVALNHGLSRLLYKSPVVLVGTFPEDIPLTGMVNFKCDGSTYQIS